MLRDKNNKRLFTEEAINWLIGIKYLKECGMSLDAIKQYIDLCLEGDRSIGERYEIIIKQLEIARKQVEEAKVRLDYMEKKEALYRKIREKQLPDTTNPGKWPTKEAQ